jgi:hypothetical protein
MALSKAQWDAIKRQLLFPFGGSVVLLVPGHRLSLTGRISPKGQRLVTMVYVDGFFRGEWTREESPIGKRFYPLRTKRVIPKAESEDRYRRLRKVYSNADARRLAGIDDVVMWRDPWWTSVDRLIAHLRKNEPDIRLAEGA